MAQTYNLPDHIKGDTFVGTSFTVTVNTVALNLTNAVIKMQLKSNQNYLTSKAVLELSTVNGGLTTANAANGIFQINSQIIDIPAGIYYYDIEIKLSDNTIKTYIKGQWKILQDITNG